LQQRRLLRPQAHHHRPLLPRRLSRRPHPRHRLRRRPTDCHDRRLRRRRPRPRRLALLHPHRTVDPQRPEPHLRRPRLHAPGRVSRRRRRQLGQGLFERGAALDPAGRGDAARCAPRRAQGAEAGWALRVRDGRRGQRRRDPRRLPRRAGRARHPHYQGARRKPLVLPQRRLDARRSRRRRLRRREGRDRVPPYAVHAGDGERRRAGRVAAVDGRAVPGGRGGGGGAGECAEGCAGGVGERDHERGGRECVDW
ncbi:hypothetical protein LTR39_004434, partial [Cryomyces antarcticus]